MGRVERGDGEVVLGVDVGGSGIKARLVDTSNGELLTDRYKIETPRPATPEALADAFARLVADTGWTGPIGCTFPGVIADRRTVRTAANLGDWWIGVDLVDLLSSVVPNRVSVINDADAAAVAEGCFGVAVDARGVAMVITLGTGIGTGMLADGCLAPNTEFGHLMVDGIAAEHVVSARVKVDRDLSFAEWAVLLDRYLGEVHRLMHPTLIVIGGGISRDFDQFGHLLTVPTRVVPARYRNEAGIVGAAVNAASLLITA